MVEGTEVGVGEIDHVNVVANSGAIGCVVVGAEDREWVAKAECCIDRQRDEVCVSGT